MKGCATFECGTTHFMHACPTFYFTHVDTLHWGERGTFIPNFMFSLEIWKHFLRYRMTLCSSTIGGPWKPNIRWTFNQTFKIRKCRSWENKFINGIWRAWSQICLGLRLEELASNEELQHQPLTWSPQFTMASRNMLGAYARLAWKPLIEGLGKFIWN